MPQNPRLHSTARAYVAAALHYLSQRCGSELSSVSSREEWVRDEANNNHFYLADRPRSSWRACIDAHKDSLHMLPEYADLIATLRQDSTVAPQVDGMVGTAYQRIRIDEDMLTDGFVSRVATAAGDLRFDDQVFRAIYDPIESGLHAEGLDHVLVAPLPNVRCPDVPMRLDDDVALDLLTDEEVSLCASVGLLRSHFMGSTDLLLDSRCALRVRYRLPKVIGESTVAPPGLHIEDTAGTAILGLRLAKEGAINVAGYLHYCLTWPLQGMYSAGHSPVALRYVAPYVLSSEDVQLVRTVWNNLQSAGVENREALGNALRRFEFANERYRPEDRLIDLLIAAESLFLDDAGDPQSRGELRYRLAMRSAFFIEMPGVTRRAAFDLMRRAYDTRSSVVHGHTPLTIRLSGDELSLEAFAQRVEECMRWALRKAIRIAAADPNGSDLVRWEDLILESGSDPGIP